MATPSLIQMLSFALKLRLSLRLAAFKSVVVVTWVLSLSCSELQVKNHGEDVSCAGTNAIAISAGAWLANAIHLLWDCWDQAASCCCKKLYILCVVLVLEESSELVEHESEIAIGSNTVDCRHYVVYRHLGFNQTWWHVNSWAVSCQVESRNYWTF